MPEVKLLDFETVNEHTFTRWDITGHQLNRPLVSKDLTGTPQAIVDFITIPPGFIHHMHRHPNADQIMSPLSGHVHFFRALEEPPVEVRPGHLLLIPRGNWHEVRNVSDEDCQVLHFFSGVGSLQDLAVEYPDDASE
jgi:quercetin dioxygenase-like cupin family protein